MSSLAQAAGRRSSSPAAHARVIAGRCPRARLHLVGGGGHMLLSQLDDILASVLPRPA